MPPASGRVPRAPAITLGTFISSAPAPARTSGVVVTPAPSRRLARPTSACTPVPPLSSPTQPCARLHQQPLWAHWSHPPQRRAAAGGAGLLRAQKPQHLAEPATVGGICDPYNRRAFRHLLRKSPTVAEISGPHAHSPSTSFHMSLNIPTGLIRPASTSVRPPTAELGFKSATSGGNRYQRRKWLPIRR